MSGYFCIAMLEDPPYNMIIGTTEDEPDEWLADLPLPSHLLCCEYFDDEDEVRQMCIQELEEQGIKAKEGKAFSAKPFEVMAAFIAVRDKISNDSLESFDIDDDEEELSEGDRLYWIAMGLLDSNDYPERFKLLKKASDLGCVRALIEFAFAYLYGSGTSINVNEAIKIADSIDIADLDEDQKDDLGSLFYYIADCYENGNERTVPDLKKSVKFYKKSAELNYSAGYFALALAYFYGNGVKKDLNEALTWAYRDIESGSDFGYGVATKCFIEAGMCSEAEKLWRSYFKEEEKGIRNAGVIDYYIEQISSGKIKAVHTIKNALHFYDYSLLLKEINQNGIYTQTIKWLDNNRTLTR